MAFTAFLYTFLTIVSLLVIGSEPMQQLNFPIINILKMVDIPVIERLDIFFTILWLGLGLRPVINLGFAAAFSLVQIFHLDLDRFYQPAVVVTCLAIYLAALLPGDLLQSFRMGTIMGYCYPGVALGYPLLLLLGAMIRGRGRLKHG